MNKKIWKTCYIVGICALAVTLYFHSRTAKFKADYLKLLQDQDVSVQLIARKLHLLGEDRAFQESLAQNSTYALSQSMERYIDSDDFSGVQILNKNSQVILKAGNWKSEATDKTLSASIKLENGYFLQGIGPIHHDIKNVKRPMIYMQTNLIFILILLIVLASGIIFLLSQTIAKNSQVLTRSLQDYQRLNADLEKTSIREQRIAQDLKSRDHQITNLNVENKNLKNLQTELQTFRIFADQLDRIFESLRTEQHASDGHIDEALHFLKTDVAKDAMEMVRFSEKWNHGVKLEGASELGPRKFFKQLSEQKDLASGKTQLEVQLEDLQLTTERLNDEVMQSCLQIAAIKNLKTSTLQFFDHWKAFLNPAKTQKDADVLLCFKEAEKMVRSCIFSFECEFQSMMVSGFLNFKTPQASRPILTSVFFHCILALLYESESSTGSRTIKPVLQVKQTAQRLIVSCFFQSQLRLNQKHKMALEQWCIVNQLLVGTDLKVERLPPAANMLSMVIQWDESPSEKIIKTTFQAKLQTSHPQNSSGMVL